MLLIKISIKILIQHILFFIRYNKGDVHLENLNKDWHMGKYSKSIPFVFLKNIDSRTFLAFQENLFRFSGFFPVLRSVREYPESNGALSWVHQ